MVRLLFSLSFLLIIACESPRNNRVSPNGLNVNPLSQTMSFLEFPYQVEVKWLVGPVGNINAKNQLLVVIKDQDGNPTSLPAQYSLGFYATMPSMGHPMDDAGYFEDLGYGIYLNKTIGYNMPGDWQNEVWIMDKEFNVLDRVIWDDFF